MQLKKNQAILAAVVAAATASTSLMGAVASAETKQDNKYGEDSYAARFLSLYDDVYTHGKDNGYLDKSTGIPYHSIEELICEAPDYGHETTSEAMSYIVWIAAMNDNITKANAGKIDGVSATSDLADAWKILEKMIPSASQQQGFASKDLSSQVVDEYPDDLTQFANNGSQDNVGKNPIHKELMSAYSYGGDYLMHWLADVNDWYGFSGDGSFTFINTFQRGAQESCFETVPHPAVEKLQWGTPEAGMKFAWEPGSTVAQWSYTNAPDAEDRAIQAVIEAERWGVSAGLVDKAAMMGDMCRNDMFDKYYKKIGCQSKTADADGGGLQGQHFLMSWYTAWGGAASGEWAWQIGCSHSHQFYQNPLAAYGLITSLKSGMKSTNGVKDYTTSLQRQLEMYLWLQSKQGPFAGGCTNNWNGNYSAYPSDSTFYDMHYIEHPVYADPGSNHWTGNQFWSTQRLAELYYMIKTDGDQASSVTPGGMSIEKALKTVLDNWVQFWIDNVKLTDDGDYSIPATLNWSGSPKKWDGKYVEGANSGLTCEIDAWGSSDVGCATSLANTLTYYAAAEGVTAEGVVKEGTDEPSKALYLAQQILDRVWVNGRDEKGVSRPEGNKSLARVWEQEVYIPAGKEGKYPGGYTVKNGAKFIDIRPMYKELDKYDELEKAYKADKDTGAKIVESLTGTDCDSFENVGKVELNYHRFWHEGDVLMALGTMSTLYPKVTPSDMGDPGDDPGTDDPGTDDPGTDLVPDWGNADCSTEKELRARITVGDAVLIARVAGSDDTLTKNDIAEQGMLNADVVNDSSVDGKDLTLLLQWLANLKDYSELGKKPS